MIPDVVSDGKTESRVSEIATSINCEHGSIDYTPVHLLTQLIPPEEYYGLMSAADVMLVTPERDAHPLTPLEYILCQEKGKKGSLIISKFTVPANWLGGALVVNPWDYKQIAQSILNALSLSDEDRASNHKVLFPPPIHPMLPI